MSLPKSVLFAAAALALFFLATPTRLAAYDGTIPSFIVPTQNYAAIDVSGGTTTNAVELMVMEDSTNVAFSYWNGSAHMVGLWRQGALVAGSPQETGSQISLNLYSGAVVTGGQPYSAGILSSSAGEVFDQITGGASLPPGALPILPVFALNTSGELAASALFSDYSTTHYLTTFWPYGTKIANSIDAVGYLSLEPSFLGLNLLNGLLPNGTLLGAGEYAGLYFNGSADGFTYTGSGVGMMTEYNTAPFSTLGCDPVDIPNCSEVEGYGITAVALAGTTGVTRYDTKTNNQNGQVTSTLKALYLGSQVLDQDTSYPPSLGDIAAVNDQSDVVVTGTYEATSGLTAGAYYKTLAGGKQYFLANGSSLGLIESLANTEIRNVYPFMMSNRLMPTGTAVQPVLYIVFNAEIRVDAATQTWSPPTNLLLTLLSDGTTTLQQINAASTSPNLRLLSINSSGVIAAIGNAGTGDGHALLLLPVQVKVVNRDDPTQTWADGPQIATGPIYSGDSDGDMVSFKIIGTDTWTGATFSWSAQGPESVTGPSGVGVNSWKIEDEDGNDPNGYIWLGWTPGQHTITCTVTFSNGSTSQLQFNQEVAQRTEQYFVAGTIPVETENTTGVLPRLVNQWECPNIFYALGAALGGGVNSTASSLYIPMDATDRVYVNNRILNATRNLDPTGDLQPDEPLSAACGLDPHKDYRFFSGCEFKFRVQNNTLASAPQVVLDNKADFVGFTPFPCSQSNAAGVIGQQSPDSGTVTGNPGDTEVTYLSKNRAGSAAQTGWSNINGRTLPWVFFRFRFEAGEDGLLHTKFSAGPSSDPNGPDNNHDYSFVPTILVYRRYYDISSNQWMLELVQTLNEQRRQFMSVGVPVPGAPFIMP